MAVTLARRRTPPERKTYGQQTNKVKETLTRAHEVKLNQVQEKVLERSLAEHYPAVESSPAPEAPPDPSWTAASSPLSARRKRSLPYQG